jgi:hypothetical protein
VDPQLCEGRLNRDGAPAHGAAPRCSSTEKENDCAADVVTKDAAKLTLTVVGDFPFRNNVCGTPLPTHANSSASGPPPGPPPTRVTTSQLAVAPSTSLTAPKGEKWSGSWKFTAVNPISSFETHDGEDNAEDENMPASMTFAFETTPTGSRMTCVTQFSSVEAMEQTIPSMEEELRAAIPQLDTLLAERSASAAHAQG